jgi:hypothetical protein
MWNVGEHLLTSLSPFNPSSLILRKATPPTGNRLPLASRATLAFRAAPRTPSSRDPRRILEGNSSNGENDFPSRPCVPRRVCVQRRTLRPAIDVEPCALHRPSALRLAPRLASLDFRHAVQPVLRLTSHIALTRISLSEPPPLER